MKIAVILSRIPYPLEKGDKLRAFHQIRELSKRHEIYLFALNDSRLDPEAEKILSPFCQRIHFFHLPFAARVWNAFFFMLKGKPIQCGYFYRSCIRKQIAELIHQYKIEHIYCQLIRTAEYARDLPYPKTLDYQDVFSKGVDRMIPKSPWWKRGILRKEYRLVSRYEHDIFSCFDHHTIITQVDRALIRHPRAEEIVVVPNGVDTSFYENRQKEKKFDLIFTGNMGYLPNIDAAECIAKEILPSLLERYPDIRIALCGANPSSKVLQLQNRHITVTGWVDDMRTYYSQAKIFIAPMRLGTGLQNKLLEAMSMRIPCITSPLAAAPLKAEKNKDLIVCNSTLGYIDAIDSLLTDTEYYRQIAENGNRLVRECYNWSHTTQILENLITQDQPTAQ